MRALVIDHEVEGHLAFRDVPDPVPGEHQALVKVEALTLNRGELPRPGSRSGIVPGWDAAGTVAVPAADGSGPTGGARVVTHGGSGAWAELRAVNTDNVAVIPAGLAFEDAAALPVAGVTALQAVRAAGGILDRRLLVTGATGGVGGFALQLAHLAGAEVVALVSNASRATGLEELGASEVVTSLAALGADVHAAVETVGGELLVETLAHLEPGGTLISIGGASGQPATFPPFATVGGRRTILCFSMSATIGRDLEHLARLVASGRVDPQITYRGDWTEIGEAVRLLVARKLRGKAVLHL